MVSSVVVQRVNGASVVPGPFKCTTLLILLVAEPAVYKGRLHLARIFLLVDHTYLIILGKMPDSPRGMQRTLLSVAWISQGVTILAVAFRLRPRLRYKSLSTYEDFGLILVTVLSVAEAVPLTIIANEIGTGESNNTVTLQKVFLLNGCASIVYTDYALLEPIWSRHDICPS